MTDDGGDNNHDCHDHRNYSLYQVHGLAPSKPAGGIEIQGLTVKEFAIIMLDRLHQVLFQVCQVEPGDPPQFNSKNRGVGDKNRCYISFCNANC